MNNTTCNCVWTVRDHIGLSLTINESTAARAMAKYHAMMAELDTEVPGFAQTCGEPTPEFCRCAACES